MSTILVRHYPSLKHYLSKKVNALLRAAARRRQRFMLTPTDVKYILAAVLDL